MSTSALPFATPAAAAAAVFAFCAAVAASVADWAALSAVIVVGGHANPLFYAVLWLDAS